MTKRHREGVQRVDNNRSITSWTKRQLKIRLYVAVTGAVSVQELGEGSMLTASSISHAGLASFSFSCSRTCLRPSNVILHYASAPCGRASVHVPFQSTFNICFVVYAVPESCGLLRFFNPHFPSFIPVLNAVNSVAVVGWVLWLTCDDDITSFVHLLTRFSIVCSIPVVAVSRSSPDAVFEYIHCLSNVLLFLAPCDLQRATKYHRLYDVV